MQRFRFRLEAVEKVRRREEEDALKGFTTVQKKLRAEIEKRQKMVEDIQAALKRRESFAEKDTAVSMYAIEDDYIIGSKVRVHWQDQAIFRVEKEVRKALQSYREARKRLRVIEKLRERAYTEWKKKRRKFDMKNQDDLYVMRSRIKPGWPTHE